MKDDRFKENIDQFDQGTAQYASDAMSEYCRVNK
ncbi:TipAS antibiotic-recognition domain-containing protein [Eremococcus coleocola]